ncbi:ISAzo13 family transposase [Candidatus Chloroploca sp. Khr17]|uniref:ISAzo13 family transposase n=1 Tax=Candidatus Chloroploca sp. Khr17 TaxID=2496869 RepID=UPI001F0DEE8E|nr:ISAzo13 family transposase [Candidatus Chloroploca sp. Khr17]
MILALVAPHTAGDPMGSQKWLNCRLVDIRQTLAQRGHRVSQPVISRILRAHDYRLRANLKCATGTSHPERDQQFASIRSQRAAHQAQGYPVISVDTKKKELVGNFKNAGQIWCQTPEEVDAHDFPQDALGRAVPYGMYDLSANCGTMYIGCSADTPTFAVDNLAHWCRTELRERYPQATHLLIEADSGGSNGARSRVWKHQLQRQVADGLGLTVTVCHYPTGASKWNPIEHRLFSEISKTWAGCPLRSFALIAHSIATTTTQTGLAVRAHLVTTIYATGVRVTTAEMATLNIESHTTCPQWNDTIRPRPKPPSEGVREVISL